ncbi:MAG: hypothetical protein AAGD11_03360 [Planctomycetota bacterium]
MKIWTNSSKVAVCATVILSWYGTNPANAQISSAESPKVAMNYVELPSTIEELRFAFSVADGIAVEHRWIAEDVGAAAPANYEIARLNAITKRPLNLARLSRPTNGWPLGLYRLELVHNKQVFHTVHFMVEDPKFLAGTKTQFVKAAN